MARKAREISKSGNYYITLKGNELFCDRRGSKKCLLKFLKRISQRVLYIAIILQSRKFVLFVKEGEKGISMTMKPVTTSYARYFNRTHEERASFLRTDLKVSLLKLTKK